MSEHRELKATIVTVSGSLLVWSVQMLIQGSFLEGGIGLAVAALGFYTYEHIEFREHAGIVADVLEQLDDDAIKDAIEGRSDQIRDVMDDGDEMIKDE